MMQGLYSENVRICPRGWVRSAGSYPNLDKRRSFNAGTYTLVRRISVCDLCAGLTCAAVDYSAASYPNFDKRETFAAYAAAGHERRNLFVYQSAGKKQKVRSSTFSL